MRNSYLFITIFFLLIGLSCNKEKPPVGKYTGLFTYTEPQGKVEFDYFEISESSKNYIVMNGSTLEKNGKEIVGTIHTSFGSFINIKGKFSHRLFSKRHAIKGTFTQDLYQGGNHYIWSGTFEINSDF